LTTQYNIRKKGFVRSHTFMHFTSDVTRSHTMTESQIMPNHNRL